VGASGVVVLLAALVACGAEDPSVEDRGASPVETGPVLTPAGAWESYPSAEVGGVLTQREGCLLLGSEVVVWPVGTTWDEEAGEVGLSDGTSAVLGEGFRGGGGHYEAATDLADVLDSAAVAELVAACVDRTSADGIVLVGP